MINYVISHTVLHSIDHVSLSRGNDELQALKEEPESPTGPGFSKVASGVALYNLPRLISGAELGPQWLSRAKSRFTYVYILCRMYAYCVVPLIFSICCIYAIRYVVHLFCMAYTEDGPFLRALGSEPGS